MGLPAEPPGGEDLAQVPPDLDQTFSSIRQAQAELMQSASQLGVVPSSLSMSPKQMLEEFYKRDPEGNIDRIFAKLASDAPALKQAEAKLATAERELDEAELNLSYCNVFAEIDGVVSRRNVNPGNNVQTGQSLMAIRSLREIWVDANFKETQLADLRIGHPVDVHVDMYGKRQIFKGRISGFSMGTGLALALLPPENATGNFVKVVQRLPVRIEMIASHQMAWRRLEKMRLEQASSLAYFDCFFLFGVLAAGLVFLVLFMKRSVAEKGAHLAPE